MNLFAYPIRMALRYGRWMARGAGVAMAGLVFAAVERRETIRLPWMDSPHEVGIADPYIGAVVAYVVTVKLLVLVMMRFYGAAQQHMRNLTNR